MSTDSATLQPSDERKGLLDQAMTIVADGLNDDPPRSDVIDAVLTHLIKSEECMENAWEELEPSTMQFNTEVIGFHYRTSVDSQWG